jgi:hypothetical protein
VSFLNVNGAIGRNRAIDVAKEANKLNAAIEKTTDPIDINQSSISDSKHEFEPDRYQAN